MPVNPDTSHANRNTLYLAMSGGGKSQALGQNPEIPKNKARVLLWDKSGDHRAHVCSTKREFTGQIKRALASGKGFRIAYSGGVSVEDWEWFCRVVWAVLDGGHLTYVIAEELSEVCPSAGKATPAAAVLLNQGRKYGLRFHGTSQKPQEIAKTFYDQCPVQWIGRQKGANIQKFARELGVPVESVAALEPMQFLVMDDDNGREPQRRQISYKKIN